MTPIVQILCQCKFCGMFSEVRGSRELLTILSTLTKALPTKNSKATPRVTKNRKDSKHFS